MGMGLMIGLVILLMIGLRIELWGMALRNELLLMQLRNG